MNAPDRRIVIDRDLPQPAWARNDPALNPDCVQTETCFLVRYIGGGKLTMGGPYATPQAAMMASDVPTWISVGDGSFRSQDGRTLIEGAKT